MYVISCIAYGFSFCYSVCVFWKLVCIIVGSSLLWSCSQPTKSAPVAAKPTFVGVVDRVYPDQKYVLVRIGGLFPSVGTTLIAHAPEGQGTRVSNLVVSPERLGNLRIPADIRSGAVASGDLVFLYRGLAAPEAKTSDEDVTPVPSEENEKKTGVEFPPGLPPGADGLLPASGESGMPSHEAVIHTPAI